MNTDTWFFHSRPSGTSDVPASHDQRGRSVETGRASTPLIARAAACKGQLKRDGSGASHLFAAKREPGTEPGSAIVRGASRRRVVDPAQ